MQLLLEMKDKEIPADLSTVNIRTAARAVLFDHSGLIPLLYVSKNQYHKIPGGGIDPGEDMVEGLKREVREEVGCAVEITGEVGKILEYRSKWNQLQTSYCYTGRIASKGELAFTDEEKQLGFQVVWMTHDEAILRLEQDEPVDYDGKIIRERDLVFLRRVRES